MVTHRKYLICLLSLSLSIQSAESLNVDELCAKRCLYGRGGVLCNCNAMHFNGKRSGNNNYFSENNHHDYSGIPDDFFPKESPIFLGSNIIEIPPKTNQDSHLQNRVYGNDNNLDASLAGLNLGKLLSRLEQESASDTTNEVSNNVKDVSKDKDKETLPLLLLQDTQTEIPDDDGDTETRLQRRREVASQIKAIMADPKTLKSDSVASADIIDDFLEDTQDDSYSDNTRRQLARLEDVLERVHQRR